MSFSALNVVEDLIHTFDDTDRVRIEAPVNIAITKYWGKRDANLNIPLNDSISITLDIRCMCTRTTITVKRNDNFDRQRNNKNGLSLNGAPWIPFNQRLKNVVVAIDQYLRHKHSGQKKNVATSRMRNIFNDTILIESRNNFPTAAGLASSASGYAALAKGLCVLYGITDDRMQTVIARHGSGSASRSIHGGFVKWFVSSPSPSQAPVFHPAFDSFAAPLASAQHWSALKVIICVASSKQKEIGSSIGQILSAQTSQLLAQRLVNVQQRDKALQAAIQRRNFDEFAYICMRDSSDFHAVCLDTFPPIFYLNETSQSVIKLCHCMNDWYKNQCDFNQGNEYMVCYTFDAGPNAVLIVRDNRCLDAMMRALQTACLNNTDAWIEDRLHLWPRAQQNNNAIAIKYVELKCDGVEKIILTQIGVGAQVVHSKIAV